MGANDPRLGEVQRFVKAGRYRLTLHAENERDQDRILVWEIEEALRSPRAEIIEDYPSDPRGPSFLLLGFTEAGMPIHAVCALTTEVLVIITLYRPDTSRWIDWRRRRGG
jgi:hypothetical protein